MQLNALSTILIMGRFYLRRRSNCRWSLAIKKLETFFTWTSWNILYEISIFLRNRSLSISILLINIFNIRETRWFSSFLQLNFWISFFNSLTFFLQILFVIFTFISVITWNHLVKIKTCLSFITKSVITYFWSLSLLFF